MGIKVGLWIGTLILLVLAACTPQGQDRQSVPQKNDGHDQQADGQVDADQKANDPVQSFALIHNLSYGLKEPYDLYMSTDQGLIQINDMGEWKWTADAGQRHDLIGFTVQDEGTMIASGHPAEPSDGQDPLGIVVSKNQGVTWEPIALHGEVVFRILEMNAGDSSILYGIADQNFEFYCSKNGGLSWEKMKTERLSPDTHALVSDPGDPESLLAGTQKGILKSEDGGKTWEMFNWKQTFVGVQGVPEQSGTLVAYLLGENEGLMISQDFGNTWSSLNLTLENDAVSSIAVHPVREGVYTVGTLEENVYQTTDGGKHWTQLAKSGKPLN